MKKLLLTSVGIFDENIAKFLVSQFEEGIDGKRVGMITTKQLPEHQIYIDESEKEMKDLGTLVDIINISEISDTKNLPEYDIYYVCGGNTFYILDRMRKTGIDKILMRAINDERLYIGVSAGSMLVGPNISLSDAYADDESDANNVGLQDLSGFGIVPYFIMPHYEDRFKQVAFDFSKGISTNQSVIGLTDMQALFVTDDEVILIGEKGGLLLGNVEHILDQTV